MTNTSDALIKHVKINRHYQRSVRLDSDFGREDALDGYICHGTAQTVLENMTRQLRDSNQRAFTWTGPYGGGKSSLALTLASAVSTKPSLRAKARRLLGVNDFPAFDAAMPIRKSGWLVVPVVGKRGSVIEEIWNAVAKAAPIEKSPLGRKKLTPALLLERLNELACSDTHDGLLLIIDEMGKFLEAAANGGDDVYFFQELAEVAARSNGGFVVVGILHQAFKQYASRLGQDSQQDWGKVQGRFVDIPLVATSDEVVELIGKAIACDISHPQTRGAAKAVAKVIRHRRPNIHDGFHKELDACWPLHPTTAALLGPVSKRQFGQNERSTFGFLLSAEPGGFRAFLETQPANTEAFYRPDHYWDFLKTNLETAIMASSDGHRWAQAAEAVERTEALESPLHIALIKSIATIDLFRNGSGLVANDEALLSLYPDDQAKTVKAALTDLQQRKIAVYRKHISAWSVFEGSDFDIDSAVAVVRASLAELDLNVLMQHANLHPIVAKQHYHLFGTLRWMSVTLCHLSQAESYVSEYKPHKGEFGQFILVLPQQKASEKSALRQCVKALNERPKSKYPIILGVPQNFGRILELGYELISLQKVQSRPELEGDTVARREVNARLAAVKGNLEEALRDGFVSAQWIGGDGSNLHMGTSISRLASDLANRLYAYSPRLMNELVNRDQLSTNSVKARRELLYKMLSSEHLPALGLEGYPAERGLYESLLASTGHHIFNADKDRWEFRTNLHAQGDRFQSLWECTNVLFNQKSADQRVDVTALYRTWSEPPFGIRSGMHPILLATFLLANKENVAVYKDRMFVPKLSEADIDECLQDPRRFTLRWVSIDADRSQILEGIAKILASINGSTVTPAPLEAARGLVSLILDLPMWAQRTQRLSAQARLIRDTLLKANDPHKVLFVDLMALLDANSADEYIKALEAPLAELSVAYDEMLNGIMHKMTEALDAQRETPVQLQARAAAVAGVTGDFRLDAFSTRLATYDGSRERMEGILSLAANRPPRDWNDRDIDSSLLVLAEWALKFRQAEALVAVQGREPQREAIAVVFGTGGSGKTVTKTFDIAESDKPLIKELSALIQLQMSGKSVRRDILLAALAEAGAALMEAPAEVV